MNTTPGMLLGTEEEYVPGRGTFVENSKIYAAQAGDVQIDPTRRITVTPVQGAPNAVDRGAVLFGRIEEIFEPVALVKVEPMETQGVRQAPNWNFYCVLHVSRIKNGYVDSVREEVKVGDVIKARVEEIERSEVYLSTKDSDLGVIMAFCSKCRAPLDFLGGRNLECKKCGSKESRKVGYPYRGATR
ncbi:MAG: exosome complex RNA-binding protein Csl4 [Candidatus Micrarchaeota archaeon]